MPFFPFFGLGSQTTPCSIVVLFPWVSRLWQMCFKGIPWGAQLPFHVYKMQHMASAMLHARHAASEAIG